MRRKIPVLIGLAVLAIIVFLNACAPVEAAHKMEQFEDKVEQKLEEAQNVKVPTKASAPTESTVPAPTAAPGMLTAEDAKAIAVEHAGLTGQQIFRLHAKYEIDDRIPQYDVEFYHNGVEYDYEIHAETGKILSFDKDRD